MPLQSSNREFDPALPAVAVIMICRDAGDTIGAAIDSVLGQTFANFEFIIVDDGSGEDCRNAIRPYAGRDPRITLVEQAMAGPAAARNRGVRTGQAPIVAFIEAADVWESDHLALHVSALEADARLGVSISAFMLIDADGKPTGENRRVRAHQLSINDVLAADCTFSSLVTHRDVFSSTGTFDSDEAGAAVQAWLLRVIASGWIVEGFDRATVQRRGESDDGADARRCKLSAWGAFLRYARFGDPHRSTEPSRRFARLMPGLPQAGLLPPSRYLAWIPARISHRSEHSSMAHQGHETLQDHEAEGSPQAISNERVREEMHR